MNRSITKILLLAMLAFGLTATAGQVSHAQKKKEDSPQRNLNGRNDRPYDAQLIRLSELLGAIHYLRELCGANDGQTWRTQMSELVKAEGTTAIRRAKLVNSFNKGYRGYRRTYRSCTQSAQLAVNRSMKESANIANAIVTENK